MKDHPAFKFLFVAVFLGIFAAVNGCATSATPASAGGVTGGSGQMIVINIGGELKKEGSNSAPNSSTNTPTNTPLAIGDEALKTAGKTAAALGSGGLSTIPQAAAKIAEDKAPLSPLP